MKKCPPNAGDLGYSPDTDMLTYMGFVYVRSDDTTCRPDQSGAINYQEPASAGLRFKADEPSSSYTYNLQTRQYVIKRAFYFKTMLDGSRRFYARDYQRYTGVMLPETVQLSFTNRAAFPLLPWEPEEAFSLKYGYPSGAALAAGSGTSYEYATRHAPGLTAEGTLLTKIEVDAVRKKALTPPEQGVVSLALAKRGEALVLELGDSRAKYYANEKLGLRIVLKRSVFLVDDKVAFDINTLVTPAAQLVLDLSAPEWAAFKKENLVSGKEYYAEWSFSRAGSVITSGEWIDKGKTEKFKL